MLGKTSIRLFRESDIPCKVRWINDSENNKFLHYDRPLDEDKTRVWFHKNKDRTNRYDAIIEYEWKSCGVIGLLSIADGRPNIILHWEKDNIGEKVLRMMRVFYCWNMLLLNWICKKSIYIRK